MGGGEELDMEEVLEIREEIDKSSSVKEAVVSVAREVLTLSPEV